MKVQKLAITASAALLMSAISAHATIITFDAQGLTGPSFASQAIAGPVTVMAGGDTVTFGNGAILTNEASLPADTTSVYYNSFFLPGSAGDAMTISFSAPINNFFFNLYNGQTSINTFIVSDNLGNSTTVNIASNGNSGVSLISFPTVGQIITISTTNTTGYDFSIDNIGFNQATPPTVPEPATWAMMLVGLGFVGHALRKRSSIRTAVTCN